MAFSIIKYVMFLFLGLIISFGVHIYVLYYLDLELFQNSIVLSYILNAVVAALIIGCLYIVRKKQKDNLLSKVKVHHEDVCHLLLRITRRRSTPMPRSAL